MVLRPRVAFNWLNGDPADGDGSDSVSAAEAIDPGFTMQVPKGDPDPGFSAGPSRKSIFDGLPQQLPGSSLRLLMEPQDIAAVPGLPGHYYEGGAAEAHPMMAAVTNSQAAPAGGAKALAGDGEADIEKDIRNLSGEAVDRSVSAMKGQGDSTRYTRADGRTYTLDGHIPNRDNNPLNVQSGPVARDHGAIGRDGKFAIFGSPADGFRAAMANMERLNRNAGTASLGTLVTKWSPPVENDTKAMIRDITRGAHLNPAGNWGDLTDAQKWDFVHSYARREGYKGSW